VEPGKVSCHIDVNEHRWIKGVVSVLILLLLGAAGRLRCQRQVIIVHHFVPWGPHLKVLEKRLFQLLVRSTGTCK